MFEYSVDHIHRLAASRDSMSDMDHGNATMFPIEGGQVVDGSMTGQAIYENFALSDMRALVRGAGATTRIGVNYLNRVDALGRLAVDMEHAWRGDASNSAQRGAAPLVIGHGVAAPRLSNAAQSMRQQAEVFDVAKSSVVPVPPMPEKPGFWENVFSGGKANERYERDVAAVHDANDHNIAVMAGYATSLALSGPAAGRRRTSAGRRWRWRWHHIHPTLEPAPAGVAHRQDRGGGPDPHEPRAAVADACVHCGRSSTSASAGDSAARGAESPRGTNRQWVRVGRRFGSGCAARVRADRRSG